MIKEQRVALPKYDEPITHAKFDGGINNDPAGGNLSSNELRDACNVVYNNKTLEKRKGGSLFRELKFAEENPEDSRGIIQGQFTFPTSVGTFYVIAKDGALYYSSLDTSETLSVMQELYIEIPDAMLSLEKYDPNNLIVGLDFYDPDNLIVEHGNTYVLDGVTIHAEEPHGFLDHDGYLVTKDARITDSIISDLDDGVFAGLDIPLMTTLVFQNYRKVEGVIYDNCLYIATGTRIIKVSTELDNRGLVTGELKAEILPPKQPIAWETKNIGFNYLSPFPDRYVTNDRKTGVSALSHIKTDKPFAELDDDLTYIPVMSLGNALTENDYYYRWEISKNDGPFEEVRDYSDAYKASTLTIDFREFVDDTVPEEDRVIANRAGDKVTIRLTVTDNFIARSDVAQPDTAPPVWIDDPDEPGTNILNRAYYKPDAVTGFVGMAEKTFIITDVDGDPMTPPAQKFLELHTCNRILADGNKMILYGTPYAQGNWYKSAVDQYDYFSDQGQLNFQTTKGERIIAAAHLDGNIIVFANNDYLGGSIHKVTGNGDDTDMDRYYSPYKKKIIHDSFSCDHPNSVQYVDNSLIFKYKRNFWRISSRELNSERVSVESVNDNIAHNNPELMPPEITYNDNYDFDLYTFVDEDTYTVVYPKHGVQYKMYHKLAFYSEQNKTKIKYPWLRDESELLRCDDVAVFQGVPTYVHDDKLIQFTNDEFTDLGAVYKTTLALKAYDLYANGKVKFLSEVLVHYHRGATDTFRFLLRGYNEANYQIVGPKLYAFVDKTTGQVVYDNEDLYYAENAQNFDKPNLHLGKVKLEDAVLNTHIMHNRVYHMQKKFPFMNVSIIMEIEAKESFSLSSVTFNYMSTSYPTQNLAKLYEEIIRED